MKNRTIFWGLCAVGAVLPLSTFGHDIWVDPVEQGYALFKGHHRSDHAHDQKDHFMDSEVTHLLCLSDQGLQDLPLNPRGEKVDAVPLPCQGSGLWAEFDWKFWTQTPQGRKNLPKSKVQQPLKSWKSRKSVKYISSWQEAWLKPLGTGLELIPLQNLLSKKEGEKLSLRLVRDGQPVEGAVISYHGKPRGTTGSDGTIRIRISHAGKQMIQASLRSPSKEKDLDETYDVTFLQYQLAEKP